MHHICEATNLKELDLSCCTQLEVLPAAFAAHGVGRRLKVLQLPQQLRDVLPDAAHAAGREWSPQKKLAAVLLRQQRRQAILKLATQPEPMLTTLERMSWLLIILATITLTAFLQPGMEGIAAGNAAKVDIANSMECFHHTSEQFLQKIDKNNLNTTALFNSLSVRLQSSVICGCRSAVYPPSLDVVDAIPPTVRYGDHYPSCAELFSNFTGVDEDPQSNRVTAACNELFTARSECLNKEGRMKRVALFSLLTISSFCLTLLCLMLIVVVSLPRLRCTDLAYEAGRLWLFLLFIWLLFVESVQLAFFAFWTYAMAVYDGAMLDAFLTGPPSLGGGVFVSANATGSSFFILGTTLLTIPALVVVCVYFSWIYPGHKAVQLACCSCTCSGYTQDFVDGYSDRNVVEGTYGIYVSACPPKTMVIKVE